MKTIKKQLTWLTLGVLVLLTGCKNETLNPKDEITKLLNTDHAWAEASEAKDLRNFISFYDSTAMFRWGPRLIQGIPAIESVYKKLMSDPDFSLTWKAERVEVSGDLGFTYGKYNVIVKDSVSATIKTQVTIT